MEVALWYYKWMGGIGYSHWREANKSNREEKEKLKKNLQFREEKEKSEIPFPSFKKTKWNLNKYDKFSYWSFQGAKPCAWERRRSLIVDIACDIFP